MTQDTKALIERKPVTKAMVIDTHTEHPDWTAPMIARHIGCSREYVYATGKRNGLSIPKHMGRFERLRSDLEAAQKRIEELERDNAILRARTTGAVYV